MSDTGTTTTPETVVTPAQVIARRHRERAAGLAEARRFAERIDPALAVRAVVVVGSYARGDFSEDSDGDMGDVVHGRP